MRSEFYVLLGLLLVAIPGTAARGGYRSLGQAPRDLMHLKSCAIDERRLHFGEWLEHRGVATLRQRPRRSDGVLFSRPWLAGLSPLQASQACAQTILA